MSLSIRATSNDGVMIVALAGSADAALLSLLQAPLADALADARLLVLDLEEVSGIDAAALRTVLVALVDGARGGQLRIAARDPDVRAALAGARIHHKVAVHHTVEEAAGDHEGMGR